MSLEQYKVAPWGWFRDAHTGGGTKYYTWDLRAWNGRQHKRLKCVPSPWLGWSRVQELQRSWPGKCWGKAR